MPTSFHLSLRKTPQEEGPVSERPEFPLVLPFLDAMSARAASSSTPKTLCRHQHSAGISRGTLFFRPGKAAVTK